MEHYDRQTGMALPHDPYEVAAPIVMVMERIDRATTCAAEVETVHFPALGEVPHAEPAVVYGGADAHFAKTAPYKGIPVEKVQAVIAELLVGDADRAHAADAAHTAELVSRKEWVESGIREAYGHFSVFVVTVEPYDCDNVMAMVMVAQIASFLGKPCHFLNHTVVQSPGMFYHTDPSQMDIILTQRRAHLLETLYQAVAQHETPSSEWPALLAAQKASDEEIAEMNLPWLNGLFQAPLLKLTFKQLEHHTTVSMPNPRDNPKKLSLGELGFNPNFIKYMLYANSTGESSMARDQGKDEELIRDSELV